ncbi:MAG: HAD hydrolase-like protein [Verrucomicrobiota bacterium]
MNEHIKAVLFDWDDTLIETIRPVWELHRYIAKNHYGKDVTTDELYQHWGAPYSELVCALYGTTNPKAAFDIIDQHRASFRTKTKQIHATH